MSELNEIQADQARPTLVVNDESGEAVEEVKEEEVEREGLVHPKEYDYLLTMPLWSLSEEKVEELTKQMQNKKDDHDNLNGTHVN